MENKRENIGDNVFLKVKTGFTLKGTTPDQAGNDKNVVMPLKNGIQNLLKILDSPVSSTGQAHHRASLEFIRRMLVRNDEAVIYG